MVQILLARTLATAKSTCPGAGAKPTVSVRRHGVRRLKCGLFPFATQEFAPVGRARDQFAQRNPGFDKIREAFGQPMGLLRGAPGAMPQACCEEPHKTAVFGQTVAADASGSGGPRQDAPTMCLLLSHTASNADLLA